MIYLFISLKRILIKYSFYISNNKEIFINNIYLFNKFHSILNIIVKNIFLYAFLKILINKNK